MSLFVEVKILENYGLGMKQGDSLNYLLVVGLYVLEMLECVCINYGCGKEIGFKFRIKFLMKF